MTGETTEKGSWLGRIFKKGRAPDVGGRTEPEAGIGQAEPVAHLESEAAQPSTFGESLAPSEELGDKAGLFGLRKGLKKTRRGFIGSLDRLISGKKEIDQQTMARLEEILVTADIGVKTAYDLFDSVAESLKRKELSDAALIMAYLRELILSILLEVESPLTIGAGPVPFVIMVVGVNGSGKTTTIAKMAARHKAAGAKVLMVAGDTFRAAAVEQLEIWGERIGCPVVKGKEKADPSSVAFEAVEKALAEGMDLVLVDTAGRLHTRIPLMEQIKKMRRTLEKKQAGAPHETLLVIDASTGQNAIMQARTFNEAVPVTGIALTKLDGTSKGGVLVGISNELKIPVRYIGIGEKMNDLRDFNARDFVDALFEGSDLSEED
jgi:fused signal recognition particle receptor